MPICTCTQCGPGGEEVNQFTYKCHKRTQNFKDALDTLSIEAAEAGEPVNSATEEDTSSQVPQLPSAAIDQFQQLNEAGRRLTAAILGTMDTIEAQRQTLHYFTRQEIEPSTLHLTLAAKVEGIPGPESLSLTENATENRLYFARSDTLQDVRRTVETLESESLPQLHRSIKTLQQEVAEAISRHGRLLEQAKELYITRVKTREEMGKGSVVRERALASFMHMHSLHLAVMLLSVLIHGVFGISRAATRTIMHCVAYIVRLAFHVSTRTTPGKSPLPPELESLLRHLPLDPRTATSRYQLLPAIQIYAACPRCSSVYAPDPKFKDKEPDIAIPYPKRCSWVDIEGRNCKAQLLKARLVGTREEWRVIRRYPVLDPMDFMLDLVSRPGMERFVFMDAPFPESTMSDIWHAVFVSSFLGPGPYPFFNGEARLLFAWAIDWYNPYTNLEAKKKRSIGAVYLVCLNLPPEERFKIENMCLIAVIPGPKEPALEQINHFLAPLIQSFLDVWEKGLWVPATPLHPNGFTLRAAVGPLVADLLGARHVAGFTFPGHTYFCSYCFWKKDNIEWFNTEEWEPRLLDQHNNSVKLWLGANTYAERDRLTDMYGIRYSEFSKLPYWNPFQQVVVDPLHMWMAILSKHARGAWHMNLALEAGDGTYDPFYKPPHPVDMALAEHAMLTLNKSQLAPAVKKSVAVELCLRRGIRTGGRNKRALMQELHRWRCENGCLDETGKKVLQKDAVFVPPSNEELQDSLHFDWDSSKIQAAERAIFVEKKLPKDLKKLTLPVLRTVAYRRNLPAGETRRALLDRLVEHSKSLPRQMPEVHPECQTFGGNDPASSNHPARYIPVMGQSLLHEVKRDIVHLITPTWVKDPPQNVGDVKQGKLSSKEWRSVFLIAFLVTLPRVWGVAYDEVNRSGPALALDNYIHLIMAVLLGNQGKITERIIAQYELHMHQYLEGYRTLYPTHSFTPYHHLSLHLPRFLRLFGPWARSWGTGPYESYNGMSQRVQTNQAIGDLEVTIMSKFALASNLKTRIISGELPGDVAPLGDIIEKELDVSDLGGLARSTGDINLDNELWTMEPASVDRPAVAVPREVHACLRNIYPDVSENARFIIGKKLFWSGMEFSIARQAGRNSHIAYRDRAGDMCYGRIRTLLAEPSVFQPETSNGRVFVTVEKYEPLSEGDAMHDFYRHHPLIGMRGYSLCRMVYEDTVRMLEVITTEQIVGHVAICPLSEQVADITFAKSVMVVIQLHPNFLVDNVNEEVMDKVRSWQNLAVAPRSAPPHLQTQTKKKNQRPPVNSSPGPPTAAGPSSKRDTPASDLSAGQDKKRRKKAT